MVKNGDSPEFFINFEEYEQYCNQFEEILKNGYKNAADKIDAHNLYKKLYRKWVIEGELWQKWFNDDLYHKLLNMRIKVDDENICFEELTKDELKNKKPKINRFLECSFKKLLKREFDPEDYFGYKAYNINDTTCDNNLCAKYLAVAMLKDLGSEKKAAYLGKFAICPEYQGNGVGKKLLNKTIKACGEKGYSAIYLRTDNKNIGKNKKPVDMFYIENAGAKTIAECKELFDAGGKIHKIEIDADEAKKLDDEAYVEIVKNIPEDFKRLKKSVQYTGSECEIKSIYPQNWWFD